MREAAPITLMDNVLNYMSSERASSRGASKAAEKASMLSFEMSGWSCMPLNNEQRFLYCACSLHDYNLPLFAITSRQDVCLIWKSKSKARSWRTD
jgi:hypothetical protein